MSSIKKGYFPMRAEHDSMLTTAIIVHLRFCFPTAQSYPQTGLPVSLPVDTSKCGAGALCSNVLEPAAILNLNKHFFNQNAQKSILTSMKL
jgi:hypothetical protein